MIAATPEQLEAVTFNHDGLVPAIAQDIDNGDVLMMAWMNRESLAMTLERGADGLLVAEPPGVVAQG